MMRPDAAHDCAAFLLLGIQPTLNQIWAKSANTGIRKLELWRVSLTSIRDRLHQTCVHFEKHDGTEEYEDIYLILFDALSMLTQALGQRTVAVDGVRAAMDHLDQLADLLASAKV